MTVRYRNVRTGRVATFVQPIRRLERSPRFVRVEDVPEPVVELVRPADYAPRYLWAEYAKTQEVATDGLTKQQIIDTLEGA